MIFPDLERPLDTSELSKEIERAVEDQLRGVIDWPTARAYWHARLSKNNVAELAEVLAWTLYWARPSRREQIQKNASLGGRHDLS